MGFTCIVRRDLYDKHVYIHINYMCCESQPKSGCYKIQKLECFTYIARRDL